MMAVMSPRQFLALASLLAATAQTPVGSSRPAGGWTIQIASLPSPAAADSGQPQLTVSSRGVLLSWIERSGQSATLKFAERTPAGWSTPKAVASGTDWFVNWADVPSVLRLDGGTLAAHWLQKSGPGTYAYDVRLAYSNDDGATWSRPFTPHHDGTQTEHGFASLFQTPRGGLGLVWLDGRAMTGAHGGPGGHDTGAMSIRYASFDRNWKQTEDTAIDLRVCECCPTAAAVTSEGAVAAFRDRGEQEIRDISVARLQGGKWTEPVAVHRDNWRIAACPVNGPALSAIGRDVAIAWFTGKGDRPQTHLAFSRDAGRTFGAPIRLDDGVALGRVGVVLLPDRSAVATYIEYVDKLAQFRVRRIDPSGTRSAPITVAGIDDGRTSGHPRIAVHGGELVFAWIGRDKASQVRTAVAKISGK